jgi:hypothetical protein
MSMHLVLMVLSTSLLSYTICIVTYLATLHNIAVVQSILDNAAVDNTIGNVTIDSVRKLD